MNMLVKNSLLKPFSRRIQFRLNMFVLFLAFPAFSVLGNSITFYLFLDLILRVGIKKNINYKGPYLFLAFLTVGFISSIFTPVVDRHPGFFSAVLILIQFIYWITLASFLIKNYFRINLIELSKWMFIGTLIYIFVFFIFPFNFELGFASIEFKPGRNALVFNLLSSIPLSFYYILKRWGKKGALIGLFFFLLVMLSTNGRAGSIIFLIQALLIIGIVYIKVQKNFRLILIMLCTVFVLSQTDSYQAQMLILSYQVDKINPRLGALLRLGDDGSLKRDKSWLQRKLLISKGKEIFAKHPFIGIGPMNFRYYDSKLEEYSTFNFLQGNSRELYNSRSAHNSYIQVLTEFGLVGFIFFLVIIFRPIYFFWRNFNSATLKVEHLPIVCLIGISIHFYAISAFTGAIPWLVIGLSWALLNINSKKKTT